jgi:hypothetical protein
MGYNWYKKTVKCDCGSMYCSSATSSTCGNETIYARACMAELGVRFQNQNCYLSSMISPGDILICINNYQLMADLLAVPMRIGGEYKVDAVRQCPCGVIYVDIGLSISQKYDIVCDACSRRFNDGIWWFDAKRFRKKPDAAQERKEANEAFKISLN